MPARLVAPLGLNNLVFTGRACVCDGAGTVLAETGSREAGVAVATVQLGELTTVELQRFGASPCVSGLSKINFRLVDCGPVWLRHTVLFPSRLPFVWTFVLEPLGSLSYRVSISRRLAALRARDGKAADGSILGLVAPYAAAAAAVGLGLVWQHTARNGGLGA